MKRLISSFIPRLVPICLALFCAGCKPQYADFFPYHDDGTPKPYVTMVPIFDESRNGLPWNVSEEITVGIRNCLKKEGKIYIPPEKELKKALSSVTQKELTSTKDPMPFLFFQPAHFVVVMELLEHKTVPYQRGKIKPLYPAFTPDDEACVLMMKMRLKIVDIRGSEPKIIRQEIVESNHAMSKDAISKSMLAREERVYSTSPLAIAHARLERDLAAQIERITCYQRS